jgi:hypothetical protein
MSRPTVEQTLVWIEHRAALFAWLLDDRDPAGDPTIDPAALSGLADALSELQAASNAVRRTLDAVALTLETRRG